MLRLSQSKVNRWLYCRGAFFEEYILGLKEYNPDFDFGTKYHKEVENYHLGLAHDAAYISHYTGACQCSGKLAHESFPVDYYGSPARVEERHIITFEHPTNGRKHKLPFSLVIDGVRAGAALVDLKTSKMAYSQKMMDESLQPTVYTFAHWQRENELLPFEYIIARKNPGPRTPAIQTGRTERTVEDFVKFFEDTERIIYDILTATSYPCTCREGSHTLSGVPN